MAKTVFVVFDTQYGDPHRSPEAAFSNGDMAMEWCLAEWSRIAGYDVMDLGHTPYVIEEVPFFELEPK